MAKKQTIVSDVASALGAAAARVSPKRTSPVKHSKAKTAPVDLAETAGTRVYESAAIAEETESIAAEVVYDRGEIARLAYLNWEARGGQNGSEEDDWLRAEQQLKQRETLSAKATA